MRNKIVGWLKNKIKLTQSKGFVLGLSGGLDSAVVAALAKQAVGRDKVLALILPCQSQKQDAQDAKLLARKLRLKIKTLDLTKTYQTLLSLLPAAREAATANLKPRLRMLTLYYFANKLNYLVCGTGNKSELMAGYFTKHGDGATDILPIGDLFKRDVVRLAKELKVPSRIIAKAPTAGLWPGQTDEGEMGIQYKELDDILSRLEKKKRQVLAKDKVNRVKKMVVRSEHKRCGPAICYL